MPSNGIVEVCPSCGRTNRIPFARVLDRAKCGACQHPIRDPGTPIEVDGAALPQLLAASPAPVIVDFWAEWCSPCRALAPQLDHVARKLRGALVVAKLNVDENSDAAARYGARAIPLLVMFSNGQPVWRATGLRSAAQLEREIRAAIGSSAAARSA